jgi:hypothetical protein
LAVHALPSVVLLLMLERERQVVGYLAQHHPRLAQRWIRARGAIGAAEDAQLRALLLASRKA